MKYNFINTVAQRVIHGRIHDLVVSKMGDDSEYIAAFYYGADLKAIMYDVDRDVAIQKIEDFITKQYGEQSFKSSHSTH